MWALPTLTRHTDEQLEANYCQSQLTAITD